MERQYKINLWIFAMIACGVFAADASLAQQRDDGSAPQSGEKASHSEGSREGRRADPNSGLSGSRNDAGPRGLLLRGPRMAVLQKRGQATPVSTWVARELMGEERPQ